MGRGRPQDHVAQELDATDRSANFAASTIPRICRTVRIYDQADSVISQYDGGVAYMDYELGEFISRLKRLGLYENTLLLITADHGESLGRRQLLGHGTASYQPQVYVPLGL